MKISEDTLSILSNYATINGSLFIPAGSVLKTISEGVNILSEAKVDETFPKDFGIYDLNEFLNAISLLEDPNFNFSTDHVDIQSGNSKTKIRYGYCDPTMIKGVPKNPVKLGDPVLSLVVTKDTLKTLKKAGGVLNNPHLSLTPRFGKSEVVASVTNKEAGKGDRPFFDVILETESVNDAKDFNSDFNMTFFIDLINKILPGEYTVDLYKAGVAIFNNKNIDLDYWVSAEDKFSNL